MAKARTVSFSFGVYDTPNTYTKDKVFGITVTDEVVPAGENPTTYLRRRIVEEFDRLSGGAAAA